MSERENRSSAVKTVWLFVLRGFEAVMVGLGVIAAAILPDTDLGMMTLIVGGAGVAVMILGAACALHLMISLYRSRDLSARRPWVRTSGLVLLGCAAAYTLWPFAAAL